MRKYRFVPDPVIHTKNGLHIDAKYIKNYGEYKLFFAQDNLVLTDKDNNEIDNMDILSWVTNLT